MPPLYHLSWLLIIIILIIYVFISNEPPTVNGILILLLVLISFIFLFHKWYFHMIQLLTYKNSAYHIQMLI
jgi:hypothetical protein